MNEGGVSVLRAALVSMVLVVVAGVLMWEFGPTTKIGFMRLKVVNDTKRAVNIQPCWDLRCWDTHGLPDQIVRPGEAKKVSSRWADDRWTLVSVGVLPSNVDIREAENVEGCLVNVFPPHTRVAVFFVSNERKCAAFNRGAGAG